MHVACAPAALRVQWPTSSFSNRRHVAKQCDCNPCVGHVSAARPGLGALWLVDTGDGSAVQLPVEALDFAMFDPYAPTEATMSEEEVCGLLLIHLWLGKALLQCRRSWQSPAQMVTRGLRCPPPTPTPIVVWWNEMRYIFLRYLPNLLFLFHALEFHCQWRIGMFVSVVALQSTSTSVAEYLCTV